MLRTAVELLLLCLPAVASTLPNVLFSLAEASDLPGFIPSGLPASASVSAAPSWRFPKVVVPDTPTSSGEPLVLLSVWRTLDVNDEPTFCFEWNGKRIGASESFGTAAPSDVSIAFGPSSAEQGTPHLLASSERSISSPASATVETDSPSEDVPNGPASEAELGWCSLEPRELSIGRET